MTTCEIALIAATLLPHVSATRPVSPQVGALVPGVILEEISIQDRMDEAIRLAKMMCERVEYERGKALIESSRGDQ